MAEPRLTFPALIDLAGRLEGAVAWVRALDGRKRLAISAAFGAASAFAYAPIYAWPLLFLTMPALVWMIDGARS